MSRYPINGFVFPGHQDIQLGRNVAGAVVRLPEIRMARYSVAPEAKDTDGIIETLTLDSGNSGALVPDGQPDVARTLVTTGDATSVGKKAIIVGTDIFDKVIGETIALANGAKETVLAYKTVESVQFICQEVYTLNLDTPSGGTYKLGNDVDGWTESLAHNASDETIQSALEEIYGDDSVLVNAGTITFIESLVAGLELDSELSDASGATVSLNALGDVKIGLGQKISLPVEANMCSVVAVYHNNAVVSNAAWDQTVDATSGEVSKNLLNPGNTIGGNYNGVKMLDIYFGVPAVRPE